MNDLHRLSAEINRSALLPNLVTVGNGICGFLALTKLALVRVAPDGTFANPENFTVAAFLILLGMVFDVFDGKLARLSKGTSELGAQLDSLCDLVTFGLVPAFMIIRLNLVSPVWDSTGVDYTAASEDWQRVVWFFCLAYFLGALLRLARFNAENSPEESAHLCFKGMPTPAAAGCVASLVLFQRYILKGDSTELQWVARTVDMEMFKASAKAITPGLAFLGPILGFTMVSNRLIYDHVGTKLFHRGQSFDTFVYLIFGAVLLAMVPEVVLPIAFVGYLFWTPCKTVWAYLFGRKRHGDGATD